MKNCLLFLFGLLTLSSCRFFKDKVTEADSKAIHLETDNETVIFTRQGNDIAFAKYCHHSDAQSQGFCTTSDPFSVSELKFLLTKALSLQGNYSYETQRDIDIYNKASEDFKDMALNNSQKIAHALALAKKHRGGMASSDVKKLIGLLQSDKAVDINDLVAVKDINTRIENIVGLIIDAENTYTISSKDRDMNLEYNILKAFVNSYKAETAKIVPDEHWISVKSGEFMMGSPSDEKERVANEDEHKVVVNYDFDMMKYDVTQGQFVQMFGYNNSLHKLQKYCPDSFVQRGDLTFCPKLPVTNVTSDEANLFALRVSKKTRLPTEREWEYAARGGHKVPSQKQEYISESVDKLGDYAVYRKNSKPPLSGDKQPWPVGSRLPNVLGLYDMSGNVWQLTSTWYDASYPKGKVVGRAKEPKEPKSRPAFVCRGGSYANPAPFLRLAHRDKMYTGDSHPNVGFRLVREK